MPPTMLSKMNTSNYKSSKRCSDPFLYSLKNKSAANHSTGQNIIHLPPLLLSSKKEEEKNEEKAHPPPSQTQQIRFTDTLCLDKFIMTDRLIDTAADIIDSIFWPNRNKNVMSTSNFVREILKRSRSTYSMLQLALFYIFRIKKLIILPYCGRRMFLAALMLASKYLNDKNYKNKMWALIANLNVKEVNATEILFLKLIDYQLYVCQPLYDKWVSLLHGHIKKKNISCFIHKQKQEQEQEQEQQQMIHPPVMLNSTPVTIAIDKPLAEKEAPQHLTLNNITTSEQQEHQLLSPTTTITSSTESERCSPYTPNDIANATPPPSFDNSKKRPFSDDHTDYSVASAVKHFRAF